MFQKLAMQSATPLKKLKTSCKQFTNKKLAPMMASFFYDSKSSITHMHHHKN